MQVQQLESKHVKHLQTLTANALREKQETDLAHQSVVEALQQENADERSRLFRDYEDTLRTLHKDLETTKHEAEEEAKKSKARHARTIEELNHTHAAEISQLRQTQRARDEQLASKHKKGTQDLRDQVRELNAALLTRDDEVYLGAALTTSGLPRKPDEKFRDQVMEIQQMVEDLGRLTWKQNQELWTDKVFQQISGQHVPRVLRKAILQDIVWTLLFHHIYCSPFRVFGEEGQALEKQWSEQCGEGNQLCQEEKMMSRDRLNFDR